MLIVAGGSKSVTSIKAALCSTTAPPSPAESSRKFWNFGGSFAGKQLASSDAFALT